MVGIAHERLGVLQEQVNQVLQELLAASACSRGDFSEVETAVHAAILQMRPLLVTEGLRVSAACAERTCRCDGCGRRLSPHSWRERVVVTAEGEATFRSVRYRCRPCGRDYRPLEAANGLLGSHFTTRAKGLIAQTSAELPYARVATVLAERGVPVSAKEADRTSEEVAAWRAAEERAAVQALQSRPADAEQERGKQRALSSLYDWKDWQAGEPALMSVDAGKVRSPEQSEQPEKGLEWFECRLGLIASARTDSQAPTFYIGGAHGVHDIDALFRRLAAAWLAGGRCRRPLVFCADGAEWIWWRVALYFPEAVQVLDIYHAGEHVASAAAACWGENSLQARQWRTRARTLLLQPGGPEDILKQLRHELEHGQPCSRKELQKEFDYLSEHRGRMPYAELMAQGLPIGSGAMESGVKQVSTQRLRQPGMMWTRQGADRMVCLRSAHLSGTLPATIARRHAWLRQQAASTAPAQLAA